MTLGLSFDSIRVVVRIWLFSLKACRGRPMVVEVRVVAWLCALMYLELVIVGGFLDIVWSGFGLYLACIG